MAIPKNTLLRCLAEALASGDVSVAEITALLPQKPKHKRKRSGVYKVDPVVRTRANELSEHFRLKADSLRFSPKKGANGFMLYLIDAKSGRVAASNVHEPFASVEDMDRAADLVVTKYLEAVSCATA